MGGMPAQSIPQLPQKKYLAKQVTCLGIIDPNNFLGSRIISNWLLAPPGHWQHVGYERHDDVVENRFELQRHHRVRMRIVGGGDPETLVSWLQEK